MAMTLGSIRKRTVAERKAPFLTFYGPAGTGKTALAAEFPAPVFLRTFGEEFPTDIDAPSDFPEAKTFDDVIESIGVLANDEHDFKTFVIDASDGIERLVHDEACKRDGKTSIEDIGGGFGKGYVAALAPWKEVLDGLEYLRANRGMTIIMLGHTDIVKFDSPTTDPFSRYRLNLHKRSADLIENASDMIGFISYRVTLKKVDAGFNRTSTHGEGGGARVIHIEERPGFIAKNRFGMPSTIDYRKGEGFKALSKYLPASAEMTEEAAA